MGKFNNAMQVSLSASRRGEHVKLAVTLPKAPVTRVRVDRFVIEVRPQSDKRDRRLSEMLSQRLTDDLRVPGGTLTLVAGDEVSFETSFPMNAGAHIRVLVVTKQLFMDRIPLADPIWTSSIDIEPATSG